MSDIRAEQNSTIIFPMPIDIIKPFLDLLDKASAVAVADYVIRGGPAKDIQRCL